MIWLVSYPRSGNTFFRNVLFHVYGMDSKPFYLENDELRHIDYSVPIIKTHHLPENTPIKPEDTIVYLIRDGRDSLVSMAHQMVNITQPGSKFNENVYMMLFKQGASFFGGWSRHVKTWKEHSDLTIRFEDLISDPLAEVEKLRAFIGLPAPDVNELPTYESQKSGKTRFQGRNPELFFHKGEVGGGKQTLSKAQLNLFYKVHGQELLASGYVDSPVGGSRNPFYPLIYVGISIRMRVKSVLKAMFHSQKRST